MDENVQGDRRMESWGLYIDIEGFSQCYDQRATSLQWLAELMLAIFRIGSRSCGDYDDTRTRIFAHQFGDGFMVTSDSPEESLERAVSIAVASMRHVALLGGMTKAAIAEGHVADVVGCYPKEVMDSVDTRGCAKMGAGLMTFTPVMGQGLIRSFGLHRHAPKGPLLVIEASNKHRIPKDMLPTVIPDSKGSQLVSLDWVHMKSGCLDEIQRKADLRRPTPSELEEILSRYCDQNGLPKCWVENVRALLGVQC